MTLLGFVNYRLYTSVGLKYPPKFDQLKDDQGAELAAFALEGVNLAAGEETKAITNGEVEHGPDPKVQAEVDKIVQQLRDETDEKDEGAAEDDEEKPSDAIDKFEPVAPGGDVLPQPSYSGSDPAQLFSKFTFFLSRETPRQSLEFILRAFGCKRIGWDSVLGEGSFTTDESDPSITHQIVDRPVVQAATSDEGDGEDNQTSQKVGPNHRYPGRVYVQPQWVWDSVNDEELKSPEVYAPGAALPPHLSPFVKPTQGQYDPTVPLEEQQTEGEAIDAELEDANQEGEASEVENDMDIASDEDDEEEEEEGDFGGVSGEEDEASEDDEESATLQRQRELEAEIAGKAVQGDKKVDAKTKAKLEEKKALERRKKQEAEDLERAKGMLSKKKRKLFEQMQYTNNKKSAEDMKLREKRRRLEKERKA
jgi:pescadillo protein